MAERVENPLNYCRSCDQDFASLHAFDEHRVGTHAYTYSEGVKMTPMREDGRRCLSVEEMEKKGWARNARGRWSSPRQQASARHVRRRFSASADAQDATRGSA